MMTPYYEQDGIAIYHGDCRDVLDRDVAMRCGQATYGLLLTDPPYGHADRWSGGTWASDPMYSDAQRLDRHTASEALAVARSLCRWQIVWGGNYYDLAPSRCWLAWVKSSMMPTLADFELAWTNFDKPSKLLRENRNPDGKRWHPTQKPESLMRWALMQAPQDAGTVLDPFMGGGTTLVAAKRLGRKAVGIELEEKYCEIAVQRLAQGALDLFGSEATA